MNAQHVNVSVAVTGDQFQLSVADGYVGQLHIRLTATDAIEAVEQSFTVELTSPAWADMVDDVFGDDEDWV